MAYYPSLEDLEVDNLARAQTTAAHAVASISSSQAQAASQYGSAAASDTRSLYAGLGIEEFLTDDFMGLDISEQAIVAQMPSEVALAMKPTASSLPGGHAIASITPKNDLNMQRAEIKQGVRSIILAKDGHGKLGFAVRSIDKGVFVSFVWAGSAASLGGLRFCDQLLNIDGENVAGWTEKQVLAKLKAARPERVTLAVRDRPWCRTVTVVKDSENHIGFVYKNGEITKIVVDSSAARNGILIHHMMIEVNGQNVVGMKDEEIIQIIRAAPRSVTLTIMPTFVYKHLIKKLGKKLIRTYMDHSIPEL